MDRVRIMVNEVVNYKREGRLNVRTREPKLFHFSNSPSSLCLGCLL